MACRCQEFCRLVTNPQVIRAASAACVSVLPRRWCAAADRFLRFCGDNGNADANFFLGMVRRPGPCVSLFPSPEYYKWSCVLVFSSLLRGQRTHIT